MERKRKKGLQGERKREGVQKVARSNDFSLIFIYNDLGQRERKVVKSRITFYVEFQEQKVV